MAIDNEQLEQWFTHHPPRDQETISRYSSIRIAGLKLAQAIVKNTPAGPDQTAAVRKVREAVMTANAAIATDGE